MGTVYEFKQQEPDAHDNRPSRELNALLGRSTYAPVSCPINGERVVGPENTKRKSNPGSVAKDSRVTVTQPPGFTIVHELGRGRQSAGIKRAG